METLNSTEIPEWLQYPPEYSHLMEEYLDQEVVKFPPWHFLNSKLARWRYENLRQRYPKRKLFAFAGRFDNDDIACWEGGKRGRIVVINYGPSERSFDRKEFASFWDWFRAAIEDMIVHVA